MAVGKCVDCTIDRERTSAWINGHEVLTNGVRLDFDDGVVRAALGSEVVDIVVALGVGDAQATAYGCDLTQGYIDENAAYYSS
jgi:glutamate N-acetyltransferase/amino-acid N-acetyltransferase